jgi:hypothetical protein
MARLYIFADEAGDFEFARKANVSRYFILATVTMDTCKVGDALVELRRELAWKKVPLGEYFHASTDKQTVRDEVFKTICQHDFRVQATVMEKSKAYPRIRSSRPRFYQHGWYYHFKHGAPKEALAASELMVVAASLGNRSERAAFQGAVDDVLRQTVRIPCISNFCPAAADPCLQVADYCAWAIQRKWESISKADVRSYKLIENRISYEFDLWSRGDQHHY